MVGLRFFAGFSGRQVVFSGGRRKGNCFSDPAMKNHEHHAIAHFFRNAIALRSTKQYHESLLNAEFKAFTATTAERIPGSANLPMPSTSANGYSRNSLSGEKNRSRK
jgi:hypothetical protein